MTDRRLTSLDAVRGIAAFAVVITHFYLQIPEDERLTFEAHTWSKLLSPFHNGDFPVFIFFVLSGYVLSLPYLRGTALSYGRFAIRRICRIYIPFAAATLLTLVLYRIFNDPHATPPGKWIMRWPETAPNAATVVGHFLMIGTKPDMGLDIAMWTLVYELRISLMFPLLILLCRDTRVAIPAALALLVASTKASAIMWPHIYHPSQVESFLMTLVLTAQMIPYFITGILLSKHRAQIHAAWQRTPAILQQTAFVVVLAGLAYRHDFLRTRSNLTLDMLAGLAVVLAVEAPKLKNLLDDPIPQWLGRISYSLYLIHLPIMFALVPILTRRLPFGPVVVIGTSAVALAATLMHRMVEAPAISLGHRLTRRPPADPLKQSDDDEPPIMEPLKQAG